MSFDWPINGRQIIKIERFCAGNTDKEPTCKYYEQSGGRAKDCEKYCSGHACNNDLSAGEIDSAAEIGSCLVCSYVNGKGSKENEDRKRV